MRYMVSGTTGNVWHGPVQNIVNALERNVLLPWGPAQQSDGFSPELTLFVAMVGGFLNASIDLEILQGSEFSAVLDHIYDPKQDLSTYRSEVRPESLSEKGVCFLRSAEAYFLRCFTMFPPDQQVWLRDAAIGLSALIARHLPSEVAVKDAR